MRFKTGDATDTEHCIALKHEFLRCEDAFRDFETYGALMIMKWQAEEQGRVTFPAHEKRLIAYKTYNGYSRFILHLYEFMLGQFHERMEARRNSRERRPTVTSWVTLNAF